MAESDYERERIKLLAGSFDRASTSCFTVGIATPAAGFVYNVAAFGETLEGWRIAIGMGGWLLAALVLHWLARTTLKDLIYVGD